MIILKFCDNFIVLFLQDYLSGSSLYLRLFQMLYSLLACIDLFLGPLIVLVERMVDDGGTSNGASFGGKLTDALEEGVPTGNRGCFNFSVGEGGPQEALQGLFPPGDPYVCNLSPYYLWRECSRASVAFTLMLSRL